MNMFKGLNNIWKKKPEDEIAAGAAAPAAPPSHPAHEEAVDGEDAENHEDRKRLWSKVSGLIGKDITSLISLPVSMFEPMSVLQSMCEPLRYADLIEQICQADDATDRICLCAAFCLALLGGYSRTVKPFNPTLGETYEFVPHHKKYKCLCEQVSHHPPIGIAHTTSDDWILQQESRIETKFWGNSVEVNSVGANCLTLSTRKEQFMWTNPTTCIHNIIFGRIWVEPQGSFPLNNLTTGDTCTLQYKKAGWFEGINYEISGEVRDKDSTLKAIISGKYNEAIYMAKVDANGNKSESTLLWKRVPEDLSNKWKWPAFTYELTATDDSYESTLPLSDSRLRGDVKALQALNMRLASKEKTKIEEAERAKRKDREAKGVKWSPVYFRKIADTEENKDKDARWEYVGNYWEEREQRMAKIKEKEAKRLEHEAKKNEGADVQSTEVKAAELLGSSPNA